MEMRARYVLVGAFVLAVVAGVLGFTYWIQNIGGLRQRAVYEVRFEEPVSGLLKGSTVLFNGIRAGEITELRLSPENPRQVTARIAVDPKTPVRSDTIVDVDYQGLIGTPAVSLRGGAPGSPLLAPSERNPPVLVAEPASGKTLTQAAREALRRVDAIVSENATPLRATIGNLSTFSDVLARNSDRIDGILAGLERLTGGGGPKTPPATYDLTPANAFPALEKKPSRQIAVGEPAAVLMFDTQKILVRSSSGGYSALENAQWSDNLPKLVQAKIVQSFENANFVQSVSRQMDDLTVDLRIAINIRGFQLSTSDSLAEVELSARVLDTKGQIVDGRIFKASAPAGGTDPAAAVPALNKAFAQAARDIVVWVSALN